VKAIRVVIIFAALVAAVVGVAQLTTATPTPVPLCSTYCGEHRCTDHIPCINPGCGPEAQFCDWTDNCLPC